MDDDVTIKDQIKGLLRNRSRILGELATVRTDINLIKSKQRIIHDDHDAYNKERGGDAQLVHIEYDKLHIENVIIDHHNKIKLNVISSDDDILTNEQRERRSLRREMMETETREKTKDAAVFGQDRGLKPILVNKNDIVVVSNDDFRMSWNKLAQDEDELCFLDIDDLEDLFEDGGMLLSDVDAMNCLQTIPTNQLGKYKASDVLMWSDQYQLKKVAAAKTSGWISFGNDVRKQIDDLYSVYNDVVDKLNTQKLVTEVSAEASHKSKQSNSSGDKIMGEMKGTVRLAAWQRQQILSPPSSIILKAEFGPEIPKKAIEPAFGGATTKLIRASAAKPNDKKNDTQLDDFKLKLKLEMFTRPPSQEKRESLDPKTKNILTDLGIIEPSTFLNRYTYIRKGLVESSESFGTVAWIGFEVNDDATYEQASLLLQTTRNFFDSMPWDARSDVYTNVEGDVFTLEQQKLVDDEMITKRSYIVIIALLHEVNVTQNLDEQLPAGLLISRAIRNLKIELRCAESFTELYKAAIPHENIHERLFGPQEDELGEEGMNPIRFAKMCRQRKTAALNAVEKAATMSIPELKKHCQMRGISDVGKPTDLVERVKKAFKKQAEIIGFGELSAFGAESVGNIMRYFNPDKGKTSIGFWELNKLLEATGTECIYDVEEYKNILKSQCLAVDKDEELAEDGLIAYYELFGRLSDDIAKIGLGSLDKQLRGDVLLSAQFEADAINTLMEFFESHTTTHRALKMMVSILGSIQTINLDGKYDHLSHILNLVNPELAASLSDLLCRPGYLATAIHKISEFLADGDEGLIRTLRKDVLEEFGKYDKWFNSFADSLGSEQPETNEGNTMISEEEFEQLNKYIQSLLPAVPKSKEFSSTIVTRLRETIERIDDIINQEHGIKLNQQQRGRMKQAKKISKEKIVYIEKSMTENIKLNAAHACAFYDAASMYAKGIATFGWGTQHYAIRGTIIGLDFIPFLLPAALGERSKIKELREEKLRRANQRKNAALAALERERNRRNIDPAEKERLAQEKAQLLALKRDKEEINLFQDAFQALQFARDERKSNEELNSVIDLFERVLALKRNRYPNSMQVTVAENNFGCSILELLGYTHNRRDVMIKSIESSTEWCIKYIDKYFKNYKLELQKEREAESTLDTETIEMSDESKSFEENLAPCIVVMQNYLSMMKGGKNMNTIFLDTDVDKMKFTILTMFESLSDKDQEMVVVGACRQVSNMPVFIVGDINENLNLTIKDGKFLRGDGTDIFEENEDDTFAEEKSLLDCSVSLESEVLDEKELKRLKYAKQRELDNKKRMKTIKDRHKLYHLIHSNEITAIFHEKAKQQSSSSNFTFASSSDSVSESDPFGLKSLDDNQTMVSMLDQTIDQSSIVTFEGDGSPDGKIYNEIQSFDDNSVAGGLSPMPSVVLPPHGNRTITVGEVSPMSSVIIPSKTLGTKMIPPLTKKIPATRSIEEAYKEAEEKQRRDANPLMQTLNISDISVADLYDSGSFIDKQDPACTIFVDNHILKTERIKEAGINCEFPESFNDIQLEAGKIKNLFIELEVANIDAKGNTKASLGSVKMKISDTIKTRNEWIHVTANLTRPSQGTISFKVMLSDLHEIKGFPNIHIYNNSVENKNRSHKKKGQGGGVREIFRKLKEKVLDL